MLVRKISFYFIPSFVFFIILISCGSSPEKDFKKANNQNTIEAYHEFLKKYPTGNLSDSIRVILAKIKDLSYPLPKLYLGKNQDLLIDLTNFRPFTETHFIYGPSKTLTWSYIIKNEKLNDVLHYQLTLASKGKTNVKIKFSLLQDSKEIELGQDEFVVDSRNYNRYSGKISNIAINTTQINKSIIFKIIASNSNFGILHDVSSFIKTFKLKRVISDDILNKMSNLLLWLSKNNKWGYESYVVSIFKNQLDEVVMNDSGAEWRLGWEIFVNNKAHIIRWQNKTFSINEKSIEEARELGMDKSSVQFINLQ